MHYDFTGIFTGMKNLESIAVGHCTLRPFTMRLLEGFFLEGRFLRAIPIFPPLRGGLLYTSFGGVILELTILNLLCLCLINYG